MPRFLIARTVGQLTDAQIADAAQRAISALSEFPKVKWIRTYYLAEEGKMYCEYEAPDIEMIYAHARRAEIPVDSVRMASELQPAMFR